MDNEQIQGAPFTLQSCSIVNSLGRFSRDSPEEGAPVYHLHLAPVKEGQRCNTQSVRSTFTSSGS